MAVAEDAFKEALLPVLRSMGGLAITTLPQGRAACTAAARREPSWAGNGKHSSELLWPLSKCEAEAVGAS